jgi:cytochrome b subunit of formate dehydrogenase
LSQSRKSGRRNLIRAITFGVVAATGTANTSVGFELGHVDGQVDYNWAKEHHDLSLEEELAKSHSGRSAKHPIAAPAE